MEIRQLRFFVSLAEELHFGHVAEREHIAQSAVSAQISRLEHEVGVRLFERSSRQVTLTDAGRALLPDVRAVLDQLESLSTLAQRWGRGEVGELVVGFAAHASTCYLSTVVAKFEARFRHVAVSLRELPFADPLAGLDDPTIDLALTWAANPPPATVRSQVLLTEPVVVAISNGHSLARRPVVMAEQIDSESQIRWPGSSRRPHLEPVLSGSTARLAGQPKANSITELLTFVALGRGIALVPQSLSRTFCWPGVTFLPTLDLPSCELIIAWPATSTNDAATHFVIVARSVARGAQTGRTDQLVP